MDFKEMDRDILMLLRTEPSSTREEILAACDHHPPGATLERLKALVEKGIVSRRLHERRGLKIGAYWVSEVVG
jgi:DNA-binding Lrp family transcriptional regulator